MKKADISFNLSVLIAVLKSQGIITERDSNIAKGDALQCLQDDIKCINQKIDALFDHLGVVVEYHGEKTIPGKFVIKPKEGEINEL